MSGCNGPEANGPAPHRRGRLWLVAKIGFGGHRAAARLRAGTRICALATSLRKYRLGASARAYFLLRSRQPGPTRDEELCNRRTPGSLPVDPLFAPRPLTATADPLTGRRSAMVEAIVASTRLGRCKDAVNDANSGGSTVEV